jgi:hypothetical protein
MKNISILKNDHYGFTIMEMLIYGAILSTFLVVLSTMFSSVLESQLESEATAAVTQDSRYVFSRLSYDIGKASAILTPSNIGDQTSSLQLTINGSTYSYALNNGELVLTNSFGQNALTSSGTIVSGLTFKRLGLSGGKQSIRIGFTLTSKTNRISGPEVRTFQTTFALR